MIFPNTHEPIVDEETWQLAQKLRRTVRRPSYDREPHPLTGLVYCADCGAKLTHRQPKPDKEKKYDADDNYICSAYRGSSKSCTMHYIKTSTLMNLILDAIRRVTENVRADEKAFIENTADIYIEESRKLNREQERQIAQKEERRKTVDRLMMKLYEDRTAGVIPEKHFERMLEEYGTEYDSLEVEIDNLKAEIAERENSAVKTDKFVEIVRKYTDITELTPAILNEFVEKVIVHERTGTRGNYHQKIEIFFKFVGQLEPE